jgi:hypothetical protein
MFGHAAKAIPPQTAGAPPVKNLQEKTADFRQPTA